MQHCPSPLSAGVEPYAVALAARALSAGKLVLYVGAGISMAPPTSLPAGATLAATIHARLKSAFPQLENVAEDDLVAIADVVAALQDGADALRQTSAISADFKAARPGYSHRALAHLMLEGAIDVLTTNWDTCIERGAGDEILPTVTNQAELAEVTPPWVLKVHGCASKPDSLLISSDHLSDPPVWVKEQTHARLGSAVVVFVGIGDIAGYVRQRIEEALSDVGVVDNIRVVSPGIRDGWEESDWKGVVPGLSDDHKIPATADAFMEQLTAAYVRARLDEHSRRVSSEDVLAEALGAAVSGLFAADPLSVLQWARESDITPRAAVPVLRSPEMGKALIALGKLAGESARLTRNHIFETDQGPVEVLIATQTVPARRLVEMAVDRLQTHANWGERAPLFLVAGGVGPMPQPDSLPPSILGETDDLNIVDGTLALVPDIRHADEVIAS